MIAMSSGTAAGAGVLGSGGTNGELGSGVELGATLICVSSELSAGSAVGVFSGMLVAVGATVAELSAGAVVGASSDSVDIVAGSAVEQAISTNAAAATTMAVNHA